MVQADLNHSSMAMHSANTDISVSEILRYITVTYRECRLASLRITSCWCWRIAALATVWWVTHRMTTAGFHIRLQLTYHKFN